MKPLPDTGYPQTGDKSKAGKYICINCSDTGKSEDSVVNLPRPSKLQDCPVCGYTYWMKA